MESSEGTTVYILCHNLIICLYCSNIELVKYTIYLKFESSFFFGKIMTIKRFYSQVKVITSTIYIWTPLSLKLGSGWGLIK